MNESAIGSARQIGPLGTSARVVGGLAAIAVPVALHGLSVADIMVALVGLPVVAAMAAVTGGHYGWNVSGRAISLREWRGWRATASGG